MADGKITIATELDTSEFDKAFANFKAEYDDVSIQAVVDNYELAEDKAKRLKEEAKQTKEQMKQIAKNTKQVAEEMEKSSDGVKVLNSSFEKSVKKVGRLAIRSAYMAVRRASSDLASYDEEYATRLEYIRYVLTQAIAPIIKAIVTLAFKLLQLINAIVIGLFGVNLFGKGSVENFQKMKAGANGVEKAVKQIRKQLLGFDEVNVLTSQTDTGTKAGIGGVGNLPDLSKQTEGMKKLTDFIRTLKDVVTENWEIIVGGLMGIAGAIFAIKNGADILQTIGLLGLIASIGKLMKDVVDYMKNPTWEKFGKIIGDIGLAVISLGLIFKDWKLVLFGIIIEIVAYVIQHWDEIKEKVSKGFKNMVDGIKGLLKELYDFLYWLGEQEYNAIVTLLVTLKNYFGGWISELFGTFKGLFSGIYNAFSNIIFGMINIFRGNFVEGLIQMGKGLANFFISIINFIVSAVNTILYPARALIVEAGKLAGKNWTINTVKLPTVPYLKTGGIINMPNKRCNDRRSSSRRKWSRGRVTSDGCRNNGNAWQRDRQIYYN